MGIIYDHHGLQAARGASGLDILRKLQKSQPTPPRDPSFTVHGTTETAIEATKLGAYDYLLTSAHYPARDPRSPRDCWARSARTSRKPHLVDLSRMRTMTENLLRKADALPFSSALRTSFLRGVQTGSESLFGKIIFSYTRAQAIADRVLIDVTPTAVEAGFRFPAAVTGNLMAEIETIPTRYSDEEVQGRLWDVMPSHRLCRGSKMHCWPPNRLAGGRPKGRA